MPGCSLKVSGFYASFPMPQGAGGVWHTLNGLFLEPGREIGVGKGPEELHL